MAPKPAKCDNISEWILQCLGWKCTEELIVADRYPIAPFLLTMVEEGGNTRHFVIDTWGTEVMNLAPNGEIRETFTGTAHKASEEEIDEFLKEERE